MNQQINHSDLNGVFEPLLYIIWIKLHSTTQKCQSKFMVIGMVPKYQFHFRSHICHNPLKLIRFMAILKIHDIQLGPFGNESLVNWITWAQRRCLSGVLPKIQLTKFHIKCNFHLLLMYLNTENCAKFIIKAHVIKSKLHLPSVMRTLNSQKIFMKKVKQLIRAAKTLASFELSSSRT